MAFMVFIDSKCLGWRRALSRDFTDQGESGFLLTGSDPPKQAKISLIERMKGCEGGEEGGLGFATLLQRETASLRRETGRTVVPCHRIV